MSRTAKKASDLVKRVKRFLARERARDRPLGSFLDRCLESCGEVYLFGGVVRDIALYGISKLESDIDLVCVESSKAIRASVTAAGLKTSRNKFGGWRVETDRWFLDLWCVEDTWAFREGGCDYAGVESLLGTTITNWESVLYGLRDNRLIHGSSYFEELRERYLDVVLYRNPNPLGMYVRILRAYGLREASVLSGKAVRVINEALKVYSFRDVSAYEKDHYQWQYISEDVYELFRNRVREPDLFPIVLKQRKGLLLLDGERGVGGREREGNRVGDLRSLGRRQRMIKQARGGPRKG